MSAHHRTAEWSRVQRVMRPIIAATLPARCVNPPCRHGGLVNPGETWDVAHIIDVDHGGSDEPHNLGPAHASCNRSAGGKAGRAKQLAKTKKDRRLFAW